MFHEFLNTKYYGLTFYVRHRQHYTCKIKDFGKWVHYDGLTEKPCQGSGLSVQHIPAQLGTPHRIAFMLNFEVLKVEVTEKRLSKNY